MIILGIDPGIATTGYGVVEYKGNHFRVLEYDPILTPAHTSMPTRLNTIFEKTTALIEKFHPDAFAIEELFFNKNIKTALTVGHARGALVLAAERQAVPIYEYTPLQVKQAVVGYGRAEKTQIQQMVKAILNLNKIPKPDDVADALAIAICHGNSSNFAEQFRI